MAGHFLPFKKYSNSMELVLTDIHNNTKIKQIKNCITELQNTVTLHIKICLIIAECLIRDSTHINGTHKYFGFLNFVVWLLAG